jgi:hypothetical protein
LVRPFETYYIPSIALAQKLKPALVYKSAQQKRRRRRRKKKKKKQEGAH